MTQPFDWLRSCSTLLAAPETPKCQSLLDALALAREGRTREAAQRLSELEELQRFFSTLLVEIVAVESGCTGEALVVLSTRLHQDVPTNAVDAFDISIDVLGRWARVVGVELPPAQVVARDAYGYSQPLLQATISELCDRGEASRALPYAEQLNGYFRTDCATAWAQLGFAPSPSAELAFSRSANAGNARPMIQDGGEEASAHGACLEALSRGLAAEHDAVQTALKGLKKLTKKRARKDVRSHGAMRAAVAAALRAEESGDQAWRDIAADLIECIWTDELKRRAQAALLLADFALKLQDEPTFAQRASGFIGENEVFEVSRVQNALRRSTKGEAKDEDSPERVAERRKRGVDVTQEVEGFLRTWDGYGSQNVARFVMGCRLNLSDEELEALLERVKVSSRPEALVKGANYGLDGEPERRLALLERGYPEGDRFATFTKSLLPLLTPELLEKAERFFADGGVSRGLILIAAAFVENGSIDDAARVVARIGQPTVSREPWTPFYRMGSRKFSLPEGTEPIAAREGADPTHIKAELKATKTADELLTLARTVADVPEALEAVVKASRLKKFNKRKPDLVHTSGVRLLAGLIDESIAIVEALVSGRISEGDVAKALQDIAAYLLRTPDDVSLERARRLMAVLAKVHPQYVTGTFYVMARALVHGLPESDREIAIVELVALAQQRYRRAGDHVYVYCGIGAGALKSGTLEVATQHFGRAVEHAGQEVIYFKAEFLVRALSAVSEVFTRQRPEVWRELVHRALIICVKHEEHHYAQVIQVERAVRYLWLAGDVEAVNRLLLSEALPVKVHQDLQRSIWADIDHSPDPLASLQGAWPSESLPPAVTQELLEATARSLRRVGHPQADSVEALAG